MNVHQIRPFVRYARKLTVTNRDLPHSALTSCDARLFYALTDGGVLKTEGIRQSLSRGTVVILAPGTAYCYEKTEETDVAAFLILNFDYTFDAAHRKIPVPPKEPRDFSPEDLLAPVQFEEFPELSGTIHIEGMNRIEEPLLRILREYERNVILNEIKISGILTEILVDCLRQIRWSDESGTGKIERILDYVHANFREPLTNRDLGERFNFHPNYVSAMIKKYTGMPLHKYLNHVRIAHALRMLDGADPSVGEMARECGFCDIYYFSRYFKESVGISPSEYKKQKRQNN